MKIGVWAVKAVMHYMNRANKLKKYKREFLEEYHTINRIPYVEGGSEEQVLSIYYPKDNNVDHLVINTHGGAWVTGSINSAMGYLIQLVKKGYTVVNINYRLMGKDKGLTVKDQIEDTALAIEYVKAHWEEYNLPKHITLMGDSSGTHLALMYALINQSKGKLNYLIDNVPTTIDIESLVLSSPIYNYQELKLKYVDGGILTPKAAPYVFPKEVTNENALEYSPCTYLDKNFKVPLLFISAKNDFIVKQANDLRDRCDECGINYKYIYADTDDKHIAHVFNEMPGDNPIKEDANNQLMEFMIAQHK